MYLCYKRPAPLNYEGWKTISVPMGNGKIGTKVFGTVQCEMIQFNESTLYSGSKDKKGALQNLGALLFYFNQEVPVSDSSYLRDLDLVTGSAMVAIQKGLKGQNRHYFVSASDNVFVAKIESTCDDLLDFTVTLRSEQKGEILYSDTNAVMKGTVKANNGIDGEPTDEANDMKYGCYLKVIPEEGKTEVTDKGIRVFDCFRAVVIMSCSTDFYGTEPVETSKKLTDDAAKFDFKQLYRRHIAEYKKHMNNCVINIRQAEENITTDAQKKIYNKGKGLLELEALTIEMGKFLLYSSMVGNVQPMAESGIWTSVNCPDESNIICLNEKAHYAVELCERLGMKEQADLYRKYLSENGEGKLINPFGYKEDYVPVQTKKSFFDKFKKSDETLEELIVSGQAEKAYKKMKELFTSTQDNLIMTDIFENFRLTKLFYDMIITEDDNKITFLQALPDCWKNGKIENVCLNSCIISFEWSDGKLKKGTLIANESKKILLYAGGKFVGVADENGNDIEIGFENRIVSFNAEKGRIYNLY